MSRWHRENPDYLETGMQPPDPRDAWDMERKRQKEEGFVVCECGRHGDYIYPGVRCVCGRIVKNADEQDRIYKDRLNRGD